MPPPPLKSLAIPTANHCPLLSGYEDRREYQSGGGLPNQKPPDRASARWDEFWNDRKKGWAAWTDDLVAGVDQGMKSWEEANKKGAEARAKLFGGAGASAIPSFPTAPTLPIAGGATVNDVIDRRDDQSVRDLRTNPRSNHRRPWAAHGRGAERRHPPHPSKVHGYVTGGRGI